MDRKIRRIRPQLITDEPDAPIELLESGHSTARGHNLLCPNCNRPFARRSHRSGPIEFLASLVLIYPYRCQVCGHRFLAWPKLASRPRHREYERLHVQFPATFKSAYFDRDLSGEGTITDLSIHGCSLNTNQAPHPGTFVQIQFRFSEMEPPIAVDVAVVRATSPRTMGIEFLTLRQPDEGRLRRLLEHLLYGRFR
jgi:hypothetical protein